MPPRKAKRVSHQKIIYSLFVGILITLCFCNILKFVATPNKVILKDTIKTDEVFWEKVKANNPTYRDAYLVLAGIKSSQGDKNSAAELIEEAKKIDPYIQDKGL